MPPVALDPQHAELAKLMAELSRDPARFCRKAYPWEARKWQSDILGAIRDHLKETPYSPCQIAVASGHGIGKSALVGMVIGWAMSTCENCKVVLTANTFDQLRTKTWPEVNKWFKESAAFRAGWFAVTATAITARWPNRERVWRTDAISWSENNTEAFAGLHNKGKRVVLIFDEASAISDKVWEVAEGALTDEGTEIIWLAFGNPTKNTGRFRECFGKNKHRWKTFQIDSRTVEGTNKAQIDKWIQDYGEDSDFVRVRVRGEFPRAGSNQFIASDVVAAARKYKAAGNEALPRVLSVDVARFGEDQTVIGYRQGRKAEILQRYRGLDTVQTAQRAMEEIDRAEQEQKPYDALVIDGDGLGAGTVDHIKHARYDRKVPLFEFHGGAPANDTNKYFNRRAEVWGLMRDWLKSEAEIPDDPELEADLTGPEYGFSSKQQIQLERKEDMKKRGLSSPDAGDMLAMTFAVNVVPKPATEIREHMGYSGDAWMA